MRAEDCHERGRDASRITNQGRTENTEFESFSPCLRAPSWLLTGPAGLFAALGEALERGALELPVFEHARHADALAHVAGQVHPVPGVDQLDGFRALLDESGLPAAPLRRVLAGRVLQPE